MTKTKTNAPRLPPKPIKRRPPPPIPVAAAARKPSRGPTQRNDYLATLLDPIGVQGVGIPDFDTRKVITCATHARQIVTTDAGGNAIFCFRPTAVSGGLRLGCNASGDELHCNGSILNLPVGYTAAVPFALLKSSDVQLFQADFVQVRPVSFAVKFVPTQAILNAQGMLHVVDYIGGEAIPFPLDIPSMEAGGLSTALGIGINAQNEPVFTSLKEIAASADHTNTMTTTTITAWTPDLPTSFDWNGMGGQAGEAETTGWTLEAHASTVGPPTVSNYYVWRKFLQAYSTLGTDDFFPTNDSPLPTMVYAFEGGTPATTIGEFEFFINWEAIPRPNLSSILPTRVTPSMPDELAQASNIMQVVPKTYYPSQPKMPQTAIRPTLMSSTTHLYDGTDRKAAVTGTSLWDKIKAGASKVLGLAAPLLTAIPKIGMVLGPGAAMVSRMLAN